MSHPLPEDFPRPPSHLGPSSFYWHLPHPDYFAAWLISKGRIEAQARTDLLRSEAQIAAQAATQPGN